MDLLQNIINHSPPVYVPPPPRRTCVSDEANITVVTAKVKGFNKSSSPTTAFQTLSPTEANEAYTVRFVRSLNILDSDIKAVWPPHLIDTNRSFENASARANKFRDKLQNTLLSTGGPALKERWFSRVVIGFISLHDFNVYMHNLQCAIAEAQYAPENELGADRNMRRRALKALRSTWFGHQGMILEKIDRAAEYLSSRSILDIEHRTWCTLSNVSLKDRGS